MMPPTLRRAHTLAAFTEMGKAADAISWWSPGTLLADADSLWVAVTGRAS